MFTCVFEIFQKRFDFQVQWNHLHETGLLGITIDQDYGSLIGKYSGIGSEWSLN
jgi:hypothetical protein